MWSEETIPLETLKVAAGTGLSRLSNDSVTP